jgi:hypothetical protein
VKKTPGQRYKRRLIDRALANLRALPPPRLHASVQGVWQLESPDGYTDESLMQMARVFKDLPACGTPLVMIPSRGVLLATGSDEPEGVTALLAEARKSLHATYSLRGCRVFLVLGFGFR